MKRLLGGTLALLLGSLLSAAPLAPPSGPGGETKSGQTTQQPEKKKKHKHQKGDETAPADTTKGKSGGTTKK